MLDLPLFEEPIAIPAFDEMVKELDALVEADFVAEVETVLEDLVLARAGATRAA